MGALERFTLVLKLSLYFLNAALVATSAASVLLNFFIESKISLK